MVQTVSFPLYTLPEFALERRDISPEVFQELSHVWQIEKAERLGDETAPEFVRLAFYDFLLTSEPQTELLEHPKYQTLVCHTQYLTGNLFAMSERINRQAVQMDPLLLAWVGLAKHFLGEFKTSQKFLQNATAVVSPGDTEVELFVWLIKTYLHSISAGVGRDNPHLSHLTELYKRAVAEDEMGSYVKCLALTTLALTSSPDSAEGWTTKLESFLSRRVGPKLDPWAEGNGYLTLAFQAKRSGNPEGKLNYLGKALKTLSQVRTPETVEAFHLARGTILEDEWESQLTPLLSSPELKRWIPTYMVYLKDKATPESQEILAKLKQTDDLPERLRQL